MFLEPASPGSPSPFAFRVAPDPLEAAVREACQELVRLAVGLRQCVEAKIAVVAGILRTSKIRRIVGPALTKEKPAIGIDDIAVEQAFQIFGLELYVCRQIAVRQWNPAVQAIIHPHAG